EAIVTGHPIGEMIRGELPLPPEPFFQFFLAHEPASREMLTMRAPEETRTEWRAVAQAFKVEAGREGNTEDLKRMVIECVVRAASAISLACENANGGQSRATTISDLSAQIFGSPADNLHTALRALLFIRGMGDELRHRWPDEIERLRSITT